MTDQLHHEEQSDRYSRQERYAPLGKEGQAKLKDSKVLIVGAGALEQA